MAILDHELDEPQRKHEPASDGWGRPLLLAGIGLVLMLGGYMVMNYVPPKPLTPRQVEQERWQTEMREAAKGQGDPALAERLEHVTPPWRTPPYEIPGRLAVYVGLFLFVAAGVLMYRHRPARKEQSDELSESV